MSAGTNHDSTDQLAQMANDIGNFFRSQPKREDAVAGIANHISSFWTPRMRDRLIAHIQNGPGGLDDLPFEAVRFLATQGTHHAKQPPGGDAG